MPTHGLIERLKPVYCDYIKAVSTGDYQLNGFRKKTKQNKRKKKKTTVCCHFLFITL